MFNNQFIQNEEVANTNNAISKGTTLRGKVETNGSIRIDGEIIGDVNTRAKIVLGESSRVEGNIYARNADIGGVVEGKVEVGETLILKPSCKIQGDIVTNTLIVESGAKFSGQCDIGGSLKEVKLKEAQKIPEKKAFEKNIAEETKYKSKLGA